MSRLRILIVTSSAILRDILTRGLSREPRLDVEWATGKPPATAMTRETDAIVLGPLPSERSVDPLELLYQNPHAILITLEDDGRTAAVRRLKPEVSLHSNVSIEELAACILSACDDFHQFLPGNIRLHSPRI